MVIRGVWGGRVVWSGITTWGNRSKRLNDRFVFQKLHPAGFPFLRPKFGSKPIITLCEVRTKQVRYISPKGTTRQWFGGISTKKSGSWVVKGPFTQKNDLKH